MILAFSSTNITLFPDSVAGFLETSLPHKVICVLLYLYFILAGPSFIIPFALL